MEYKPKFRNKPKKELFNIVRRLCGTNGYLKRLLVEYKAAIMIQNRQIELLNQKLSLVEERLYRKNRASTNYSTLGRKYNRDIGTMKRRNKKSYQTRCPEK